MPAMKKMKKAKATMVYLEEQDHARLKQVARRYHTSMADLLRQMVAEYMERHGYGKRKAVAQ